MRFSIATTCVAFLLLQVLPPEALAASSDSFPWSDGPTSAPGDHALAQRDRHGAFSDSNMQPDSIDTNSAGMSQILLQPVASNLFTPGRASLNWRLADLGTVAPGGTISDVGIAQGNVGPTQSGPGAAGLFTPNSPGNAAAYDAQLRGGLQGSPIVDGSGANLRIFVPVPTPSGNSTYLQYMSGGVTGIVAPQAAFRQVINRPSVPESIARAGTAMRTVPLVWPQPNNFPFVFNHVNHRPIKTNARSDQLAIGRLSHLLKTAPNSGRWQDIIGALGDVTGTMQYADGSVVLFGTRGTLRLESDRSGTLSCSDGRVITFHDFSGRVRQLAQGNQLGM